jgi:methyl-accepting chemotaxis protein
MIVALVAILGWVAISQIGKLRDSAQDITDNWMVSISQTALIDSSLLNIRLEILRAATTKDAALRQKGISALSSGAEELASAVKQYGDLISSEPERALYDSMQALGDKYSSVVNVFETIIKSEDTSKAFDFVETDIRPLGNKLQESVKHLTDYNNEGAASSRRSAEDIYSTSLKTIFALLAAVILLTVALAVLLVRSLTVPISDALSAAERIAGSDLSKAVPVIGTDEAGRLLKALSQMQENLRATILKIADSSNAACIGR